MFIARIVTITVILGPLYFLRMKFILIALKTYTFALKKYRGLGWHYLFMG